MWTRIIPVGSKSWIKMSFEKPFWFPGLRHKVCFSSGHFILMVWTRQYISSVLKWFIQKSSMVFGFVEESYYDTLCLLFVNDVQVLRISIVTLSMNHFMCIQKRWCILSASSMRWDISTKGFTSNCLSQESPSSTYWAEKVKWQFMVIFRKVKMIH